MNINNLTTNHNCQSNLLKRVFLVVVLLASLVVILIPSKSRANCLCRFEIPIKAEIWKGKLDFEFKAHTMFMVTDFYLILIKPALVAMTEQLTATAYTQVGMIGTFFDAKNQMDRQLLIDKAHVQAIKDYQPSSALCKFGTVNRGLASSEQRAKINQSLFMKRSLDRHLGAKGTIAASIRDEKQARLEQFTEIYCNPEDNRGFLAGEEDDFCGADGGDPERYNKDINYTRTFDAPLTLDIDLTDTSTTADEEDIFALANNLFGYDLIQRPNLEQLKGKEEAYHEARAAIAKRSVAENSFYAIIGQKTKGTGAAAKHIRELIKALGIPGDTEVPDDDQEEDDITRLIGKNPSYYAQMEVLTKKIYQDPNFITSLIDKPANIDRQISAMESIRIMQQRDYYQSLNRQNMALSVILEELLYDRYRNLQSDLE